MMISLMKKLPNMLTLFRVVLSCIVNVYIFNHFKSVMVPIIIVAAIFLTDFFDGKLARSMGKYQRSVLFLMCCQICFILFFHTLYYMHSTLFHCGFYLL